MAEYFGHEPAPVVASQSQPGPPRPVVRDGGELPRSWSIEIGECLHSMRSALDMMAWACALRNTAEPSHGVAFPISTDADDWEKIVKGYQKKLMLEIGADAWNVIEGTQPHTQQRPADRDPLWVLNELGRIDRHRKLHLTVVSPQGSATSFGPADQTGNVTRLPDGTFELFTPSFVPKGGPTVTVTGDWKIKRSDGTESSQLIEYNYLSFRAAIAPEGAITSDLGVVETLRGIEFNIRTYVMPAFRDLFAP